jgi:3-hydroxyphenylacetate 6-hydroxylase
MHLSHQKPQEKAAESDCRMISDIRLHLSPPFTIPLNSISANTATNAAPIVLFAVIVVSVLLSEVVRARGRVPGIDGPRGLPIVGNLTQLKPDPAEKLRGWAKQYGSVFQIMIGNEPIVVFNSMEAANDVFIGQGGSLVDRPQFYTFHKVLSKTAASFGTLPWYPRH